MNTEKKWHWLEVGTKIPLYTVFAKNEKLALKKLTSYLAKIGKSGIELVKVTDHGEATTTPAKTANG